MRCSFYTRRQSSIRKPRKQPVLCLPFALIRGVQTACTQKRHFTLLHDSLSHMVVQRNNVGRYIILGRPSVRPAQGLRRGRTPSGAALKGFIADAHSKRCYLCGFEQNFTQAHTSRLVGHGEGPRVKTRVFHAYCYR